MDYTERVKCPDCATMLTSQPSVAGVISRCYKCGGFWLDAGTANNLTAAEIKNWRRISISSSYLSAGKGVCPADGQRLARFSGDQVPMNVNVMHCDRCGRWWFPGDNLFKFKPLLEAKRNYMQLWRLPVATGVLVPLAIVAFLAGATITGVNMVRQPQQAQVAATGPVTELSGTYLGEGKAMVVFKSEKEMREIDYRTRGSFLWKKGAVNREGEYYVVWLEGLTEGKEYMVRVEGEEYWFKQF